MFDHVTNMVDSDIAVVSEIFAVFDGGLDRFVKPARRGLWLIRSENKKTVRKTMTKQSLKTLSWFVALPRKLYFRKPELPSLQTVV